MSNKDLFGTGIKNSFETKEVFVRFLKNRLLCSMVALLLGVGGFQNLNSQTTLATGDIAFTGYRSDTPDLFSFVLMTCVESGTQIHFTDYGWLASGGFRTTGTNINREGALTWTAGSELSCGTEITITTATRSASTGNVAIASFASLGMILDQSGDQVFGFQGTLASPVFLSAIHMNGNWDADATSQITSARPSGLTDGVNAISFDLAVDNAAFSACPASGTLAGTATAVSAMINNNSNWNTSDTGGITVPESCTYEPCTTEVCTVFEMVPGSFVISDPCDCNEDQSANGAHDGTFSETVSISGTPGFTVIGAFERPSSMANVTFTESPAGSGNYSVTFNHADGVGYNLCLQNTDGTAILSAGGNPLCIENVCEYPELNEPNLGGPFCLSDPMISDLAGLINRPTESGVIATTVNGITSNTFNPNALGVGVHTIRWTYDGDFVDNIFGTLSNPAFPGCTTEYETTVEVILCDCPQSLGCNDNIQISLGYDCTACITPDLIIEDEMTDCTYSVEIFNQSDILLASTTNGVHPCIDGTYIGETWKATVSFVDDNNTKISCWGNFTVEDKLPPVITCLDDVTVKCNRDLSQLLTSTSKTTYIYNGGADQDSDPTTVTLDLCNTSGTAPNPWELINSLDFTFPGPPITGSGSAVINGVTVDFNIINGEISGDLLGAQVDFDDCMQITLPVSNVNTSDNIQICANSISFHDYQVEDNCHPDVEVLIAHDETLSLDCSDDITARRIIRYYTRDNVGLSPRYCEFSIFFEKKELTDIVFPPNYYEECRMAPMTNGMLDLAPENTGYPTLHGEPLVHGDNLCRMNVTFSDDTFNICGSNTMKILRRWTALDWCEGNYSQSYQTIKIEDNEPPVVSTISPDFSVTATQGCTVNYELMPFSSTDPSGTFGYDCSDVTVTAEFLRQNELDPDDPSQNWNVAPEIRSNVFLASGLQGGQNWIRYTFEDACGLTTQSFYEITVVSGTAPIPVCDQYTVVSLDKSGWGRVYAASIDDESHDACGGDVDLQILRESPCAEVSSETVFADYASFCCEDVGDTIQVTLQVTADNGLSNTCDAYVVVQNKSNNAITCPTRLLIPLDCENVDNISPATYGMPSVVNNSCGSIPVVESDDIDFDDLCGDGQIVRSWFAEINGVRTELTSCKQTFTFESNLSLTVDSFEWPADRNDATCNNYTTDLGDAPRYPVGNNSRPVNEASVCGNLTYTFEDRVFQDVEGYCLKVIRTWTVIDWCLADDHPNDFTWSRNQIIKVKDTNGPEFARCPDDMEIDIFNDDCTRSVSFTAPQATDLCLNEVIDTDDIGWTISGTNHSGTGNIPATELSPGMYTVTWSARGICGATSNDCTHKITINDKKPPVPYCLGGVTTVLMPIVNNGDEPYVELWASDFVLSQTDNCGNVHSVSFSENTQTDNMVFTCDDLGMSSITIWFTDSAGNSDYCEVTVNIQANNNICDGIGTGGMIAGYVETEWQEKVEGVEVALMRMADAEMKYNMTGIDGEFAFSENIYDNDYQISVNGEDDYLNGVSTLDLLIMQKHILGVERLDSPYKVIAADIDQSESITAIDLIELRKLILGIYDELPNNDSWKFVNKDQQFANVHSPWPIQEEVSLYGFDDSSMENDFVAVKIGDVNNNVQLSLTDKSVDTRTSERVYLTTEFLEIGSNQYLVPFYFSDSKEINAFQFNLALEHSGMDILEVESGRLDIVESNYNNGGDAIKLLWHSNTPKKVKQNEALFYLTIRSDKPITLDMLSLVNDGLDNEVIDTDWNSVITAFEANRVNANVLFQNTPNPFSNETTISFALEASMPYEVTIIDTKGQIVDVIKGIGVLGINNLIVNQEKIGGAGIYYYQLKAGQYVGTKKMISVD